MVFNFQFAVESFPQILSALPVTVFLALIGIVFSTVFGFLIALCRIYHVPVLGSVCKVYLLIIRGIPLMVQLYFVFVALPLILQSINPHMVVNPSPILIATIALVFNYTAYMSEVIRSAILAVDSGQLEAAHSIGMTTSQAMARIIIPQAFVIAVPNLGNTFIGLVKDTSLAYMVMVVDILGMAKRVAGSGLNYFETYVDAALIYWVLNILLERAFAILEKKVSIFNRKSVAKVRLQNEAA